MEFHTIITCILKLTLPTNNSFRLITSHMTTMITTITVTQQVWAVAINVISSCAQNGLEDFNWNLKPRFLGWWCVILIKNSLFKKFLELIETKICKIHSRIDLYYQFKILCNFEFSARNNLLSLQSVFANNQQTYLDSISHVYLKNINERT